jgi:hypothetical protein
MIIISNKPGQLANLLFIYANFIAFCTEHKIRLLNPAFYSYRYYFKGTSRFSLVGNKMFYTLCYYCARLLFYLKTKNKLLSVIALEQGEKMDLKAGSYLNSKLCFVQGWLFRNDELIVKHKSKILSFFLPKDDFKKKIDLFFNACFKNKNEITIGVHIRHGDYRTFEDGKYYYSLDQYQTVMMKVGDLFPDRQVHFLICSNENINLGRFSLPNFKITLGPKHELMDLYCLARCAYIIGPPSTYTMWASFYGNVPLYMIHDPLKTVAIKDFKPFLT